MGPPPGYGAPPPGYGAPPAYGAPPPGPTYGAPPPIAPPLGAPPPASPTFGSGPPSFQAPAPSFGAPAAPTPAPFSFGGPTGPADPFALPTAPPAAPAPAPAAAAPAPKARAKAKKKGPRRTTGRVARPGTRRHARPEGGLPRGGASPGGGPSPALLVGGLVALVVVVGGGFALLRGGADQPEPGSEPPVVAGGALDSAPAADPGEVILRRVAGREKKSLDDWISARAELGRAADVCDDPEIASEIASAIAEANQWLEREAKKAFDMLARQYDAAMKRDDLDAADNVWQSFPEKLHFTRVYTDDIQARIDRVRSRRDAIAKEDRLLADARAGLRSAENAIATGSFTAAKNRLAALEVPERPRKAADWRSVESERARLLAEIERRDRRPPPPPPPPGPGPGPGPAQLLTVAFFDAPTPDRAQKWSELFSRDTGLSLAQWRTERDAADRTRAAENDRVAAAYSSSTKLSPLGKFRIVDYDQGSGKMTYDRKGETASTGGVFPIRIHGEEWGLLLSRTRKGSLGLQFDVASKPARAQLIVEHFAQGFGEMRRAGAGFILNGKPLGTQVVRVYGSRKEMALIEVGSLLQVGQNELVIGVVEGPSDYVFVSAAIVAP